MTIQAPELVLRIGSHAEKDYLLKLAQFIDGVIVGANLFEASPGATASLLLTIAGKETKLFIDPMTYAFGEYTDPDTGKVRRDLDWIKSDQIKKNDKGRKVTVRDFKRSYKTLAEALGSPIADALRASTAIRSDDFKDTETVSRFCQAVVMYQQNRIINEFQHDDELRDFIEHIPRPAALFAPYFYVEPHKTGELLDLNIKLMTATALVEAAGRIHGVLCADASHLDQPEFIRMVRDRLPKTGIAGIWLWFSGFHEEYASLDTLRAYRDLVSALSKDLEVFAMHGGFLSMALSTRGIAGVSHGVGYGEQKDVVPVIGQSTPTVRYYLPPLARRLGVPEVQRAFHGLGIRTPRDFHESVCNCAVCRGVVVSSVDEFAAFGDMHYSRPESKRKGQTPAAAKRCRFHFLLSRLIERDTIRRDSIPEIVDRLRNTSVTWARQPSLATAGTHVEKWISILSE